MMQDQSYLEQKTGKSLTVKWEAAVITYAQKLAMYGFMFGAGIAAAATFYTRQPNTIATWIYTLVIIGSTGLAFAGFFGGLGIVIKDLLFPYVQPYEKTRSLPVLAAPDTMRPRPLMRQDGTSYRYGKAKIEPARLLNLAKAIIVNGETTISQRKLAEWQVVPTKESQEAKQLKIDLETLGYAIQAGNDQLTVTDELINYLADLFPALSPYPNQKTAVSSNGVDRHHH